MHQTNFATQRTEATTKISSLESSSADGWSTAKTNVEKQLDNLENTLSSMEKDF